MQTLRLAVPALALMAVLSSVLLALCFAAATLTADGAPRPTPGDHESAAGVSPDRAPREAPEGKTLSASIPAEDVRGEPIPGLPRYPGSVRVAYSEGRTDGLIFVRAGYLAQKRTAAVRNFYAGVFNSGGWRTANVEYVDGELDFLAVSGEREAVVRVSPHGGGSRVEIEVTRPRDGDQEGGSTSAGGSKR